MLLLKSAFVISGVEQLKQSQTTPNMKGQPTSSNTLTISEESNEYLKTLPKQQTPILSSHIRCISEDSQSIINPKSFSLNQHNVPKFKITASDHEDEV